MMLAVIVGCKGSADKADTANDAEAGPDSSAVLDEDYYEPPMSTMKFEGGHVSVSEDGRMTVESDAHPDGGTCPEYWAKYKFLNQRGDTCEVIEKYSPYISTVHSIRKHDGSTYYIVEGMVKASSSEAETRMMAYRIAGDTLRQVSVVDGGDKLEQNKFEMSYNVPNWYFATNGAGYDWIFEYEPKTRRLFIPLADKDNIYDLTDRYRVWQFDGHRFVDKGEQAHKDLHPSVRAYHCLVRYFTTKDYIVRVDSLADRQLRYASWRKPKTMSDAPDLVLTGGVRRTFPSAPDEHKRDDEFAFRKGDMEYIVDHEEVVQDKNGSDTHSCNYLLVKKRGRVVMKQQKADRD